MRGRSILVAALAGIALIVYLGSQSSQMSSDDGLRAPAAQPASQSGSTTPDLPAVVRQADTSIVPADADAARESPATSLMPTLARSSAPLSTVTDAAPDNDELSPLPADQRVAAVPAPATVQPEPEDSFDYAGVCRIYLVRDGRVSLLGRFQAFHKLKGSVLDAVEGFATWPGGIPPMSYAMTLVSGREHKTLLFGTSALVDGARVALIDAPDIEGFMAGIYQRHQLTSWPAERLPQALQHATCEE